MRNWKPISFEEFRCICNRWLDTYVNKIKCNNRDNRYRYLACCPSNCSPWRKLGKNNLTVVKRTKYNGK